MVARAREIMDGVCKLVDAFRLGDLDEANRLIHDLDKVSGIPSGVVAEAFFHRGKLSDDFGDYRLALAHYKRAVELNPFERKYWNVRVLFLLSWGFILRPYVSRKKHLFYRNLWARKWRAWVLRYC